MKILIIGANGQVGHELNKQIDKNVHRVQATVRSPDEKSNLLALDLTQIDDIDAVVENVSPEIIINAAAYTAVDKAETEQDLALAINSTAVQQLAKAAKKLGAVLIHYSTDYVFDGSGDQPRKEDEKANPVNFYGKSKWHGEEAIRKSGCTYLIFRTSWVYGVHGNNFVKTMLRLGEERKELSVVADQVGSPTSAAQIASATLQVINRVEKGQVSWQEAVGTYHLAGTGFTNWAEFASEIFIKGSRYRDVFSEVKVKPIASTQYPTPARRPTNSRLDCSKFESKFDTVLPRWSSELSKTVDCIFGPNSLPGK